MVAFENAIFQFAPLIRFWIEAKAGSAELREHHGTGTQWGMLCAPTDPLLSPRTCQQQIHEGSEGAHWDRVGSHFHCWCRLCGTLINTMHWGKGPLSLKGHLCFSVSEGKLDKDNRWLQSTWSKEMLSVRALKNEQTKPQKHSSGMTMWTQTWHSCAHAGPLCSGTSI